MPKNKPQYLTGIKPHTILRQTLIISCLAMSVSCHSTPAPEVSLSKVISAKVMIQGANDPKSQADFAKLLPHYPQPQASQSVHIISGQPLKDADKYLLEFQVGLTLAVDCNPVKLMGDIQTLALEDKHYYRVDSLMQAPTVRLPCTPGEEHKFIQLGDTISLGYDKLSDAVFYLPAHAQLRYRLLRAQDEWTFSQ